MQLQFVGHTRISRYLWPAGIRQALKDMLDKYTDDMVYVEPGDVVVDVGANVGEFSLAVLSVGATCISIEPEPLTYKALSRNVDSVVGARSFNIAISSSTGQATFFVSNADADSSLIAPETWTSSLVIESITLSDFAKKYALGQIDFLKIEAEGAEPEILSGAEAILQYVRKVAVDCGPERYGQTTDKQVRTLLRAAGFSVREKGHVLLASRQGV